MNSTDIFTLLKKLCFKTRLLNNYKIINRIYQEFLMKKEILNMNIITNIFFLGGR